MYHTTEMTITAAHTNGAQFALVRSTGKLTGKQQNMIMNPE